MKRALYAFLIIIFTFLGSVNAGTYTNYGSRGSSCSINISCNSFTRLGNGISFNPSEACQASFPSVTNGYCNESPPSCPTECGFGGSSYAYYNGPYNISCGWTPGNVYYASNGVLSLDGGTFEACYVNSSQVAIAGSCEIHYGSCPATAACPVVIPVVPVTP